MGIYFKKNELFKIISIIHNKCYLFVGENKEIINILKKLRKILIINIIIISN